MATHLRAELVLEALNMALWQRQPEAVIHHSDQGCQYTSIAFGLRCRKAGVRPSMGSTGDCYDNALCESFFATLECERLDRRNYRTQAEARMSVFQYIEGWYNPHRRHSALGYLSPMNFERRPPALSTMQPTESQLINRPLNRGNSILHPLTDSLPGTLIVLCGLSDDAAGVLMLPG